MIALILFLGIAHAQYNPGLPIPGLPKSVGQKTKAGSTSVTLASDQGALPISGSITVSATAVTVSATTISRATNGATNATLLAANGSRYGLILYNDSVSACYYKFGTTATTASYTLKLFPTDTYVMDAPTYTGAIDFLCDTAVGYTQVTSE